MNEKDIVETVVDERVPTGFGGRWYGVHPALVADVRDPEHQGRVKITLPWAPDGDGASYEAWARLATMMAGKNRGSWFIPDVGDEVLVGFEHGDPRRPYVLGSLWNGQDKAPESMDGAGRNNKKVLRSRRGVRLTIDDSEGRETLVLETPAGQMITLQDGVPTIEIKDSSGNTVKLTPSGISVVAAVKITIQASTAEITASMLTVNAGMSKFSGVVQADTLITNSVVSASYTPGAGNVW